MTPWHARDWLVVDVESTGLDIDTIGIVELGAAIFRGGEPLMEHSQSTLINPGMPIPAEASAIHGITDADVAGAPSIEAAAPALLHAIGQVGAVLAYNGIGYDFLILSRLVPGFRDACKALVARGGCILDPLIVVREAGRYWRGKGRHRLTAVRDRLGLPVEEEHRALGDCLTAGRVLWSLRGELPDDPRAAQRWCVSRKKEQDERFAAWLAGQKAKEQG